MNNIQRISTLLFLLVLVRPSDAQISSDWEFDGDFQLGVRLVDVDGREEKYREDYGLEEGPRLFNLDFELTPPKELRHLFDRIEVDLSNLGGDPYETIRVSVEKYGHYSLNYDHRMSSYFYEDIILPLDLADPAAANVGDVHHFDVERVQDRAQFEFKLSQKAKLDFRFNRMTRKGMSTTTFDIERDEFEFEQPVDESLNEYSLGFEYQWDRATLSFEERFVDFENVVESFLPGFSRGEDPEDGTILLSYGLGQPYDLTGRSHTLRLATRPVDRLSLRLTGVLENNELDFTALEELQGTDWQGNPIERSTEGGGAVDSDRLLLDLDMTWRWTRRLSLIGSVRHRELEQEGNLLFGDEASATRWDLETDILEAGIQVMPAEKWSITGGGRWETRDVGSESADENEHPELTTTDHSGYFLAVDWRPLKHLRLDLDLQDSSFDHPYTLSSPTDRQTTRFSVIYGKQRGLQIKGTFKQVAMENQESGWDADSTSWTTEVGYRSPIWQACLGYTDVSVDRSIDQTILPGDGSPIFYPIAYGGDSDLLHGRGLWAVAGRVRIGGEFRLYENSGSFAVERDDIYGWLEVGFGAGYVTRLGYRLIDLDEGRADWDDYEATIAEISIGRRW